MATDTRLSGAQPRLSRVDASDPDVLAVVLQMHETCFPGYVPFEANVGDLWIAYDGDFPAAFCALWPSVRMPATGYLARSGVLPAYRGHGLQRRMMLTRERAARRKGWLAMISDTVQDNVHSANNFIKAGYHLFVPDHKWASDPAALYWRKFLVEGAP